MPKCNSNGDCQYKRVGAAVETLAVYGTASVEVRMKPCADAAGKPITGAVSTLWLYNYTERYCDTSNPCKVIGKCALLFYHPHGLRLASLCVRGSSGQMLPCSEEYAAQCCSGGVCKCNANGGGSNDVCQGHHHHYTTPRLSVL